MIKNLIFSQVRNKHSRLQVTKGQAKNLSFKTPPDKLKDSLLVRLKRYFKFIVPFYGGYLVLRYYNDAVMGVPDGDFPNNKKSFIRLQELEKVIKMGTVNKIEMFGESSKVYVYLERINPKSSAVNYHGAMICSVPKVDFLKKIKEIYQKHPNIPVITPINMEKTNTTIPPKLLFASRYCFLDRIDYACFLLITGLVLAPS